MRSRFEWWKMISHREVAGSFGGQSCVENKIKQIFLILECATSNVCVFVLYLCLVHMLTLYWFGLTKVRNVATR